jgi:hypothetical protein
MSAALSPRLRNPFQDYIAHSPRERQASVKGLNDKPLQSLIAEFERLSQGLLPRPRAGISLAQIVMSVEPGYGKSHLIGRLFDRLRGRGTLVYLRPMVAAHRVWTSLLDDIVRELRQPDDSAEASTSSPTQLEAFACGVLSHMVVSLLSSGHLQAQNSEAAVSYLTQHPLDAFGLMERTHDWSRCLFDIIPQRLPQIERELNRANVPSGDEQAWAKVLLATVMHRGDSSMLDACCRWMSGKSIPDSLAERIGLTISEAEVEEEERSAVCQRRIQALACLAGYYRPFVVCFDQVDAYADSPDLAKAFSHVVEFLVAQAPHLMTVVTTNQEPWESHIHPYFQIAQRERFARPVELEGLTKEQAMELVSLRLTAAGLEGHPQAGALDGAWLDELFAKRRQMAPRAFLAAASERWTSEPATRPDIDQVFADLLAAKESRTSSYSRDLLWWLINDIAAGEAGLTISRVADNYVDTQWSWAGHSLIFGAEDGDHALTWRAIVSRAEKLCQQGARCIMLRGQDQPSIPKASWGAVATRLKQAESFMTVHVVPERSFALLETCRGLVNDATAGDVPFSREEAMALSRKHLLPLVAELKELHRASVAPAHRDVQPATGPLTSSIGMGQRIVELFGSFNLEVKIQNSVEAPQLMRYRLTPGEGVTVNSLRARTEDLQVALNVVQPPLIQAAAGCVTVDLPKRRPDLVAWKDLISSAAMQKAQGRLAFPVGVTMDGEVLVADFGDPNTCHALVAGSAGSGKSEFLRAMVASLMQRNAPSQLHISLIDPKQVTFADVAGSPYIRGQTVTTMDQSILLLRDATADMERRYSQLRGEGYKHIQERYAVGLTDLPQRLILIDEFGDLIHGAGGAAKRLVFAQLVSRLASMGRAAGIHMVLATQHPSAKIITGDIKANLPLVVCMRVVNHTASQVVIGEAGGESLLGRGDMLCNLGGRIQRAQAPLVESAQLADHARGRE